MKNTFQNKYIKDIQHCGYIGFIGVAPNALYMRLEKIKETDFYFITVEKGAKWLDINGILNHKIYKK